MYNGKEVYLGLDVSTKTIGVCLLADDGSEHGNILELTHITPKVTKKKCPPIEELFIKKNLFEEFILKFKDYGIDHVVIEEPLLLSNNAMTVSTLLRFNGMISETVYRLFGIVPEYISSYDARKYAFPELVAPRKYGKNDERYPDDKIIKEVKKGSFVLFGGYPWTIDKKTIVQNKVSEYFPSIEWLYDKKGSLLKQNFDAADAYVAVLGHLNKKKNGELNFELVDMQDDSNTKERCISYTVSYWEKKETRKIYLK